MRIAICTNVVPASGSGVGTMINALVKGLSNHGNSVDVISALGIRSDFRSVKRRLINSGMLLLRNQLVLLCGYRLAQICLANRLAHIIKNAQYDIIHAHDVNALNSIFPVARKIGVPLVLTVHGLMSLEGINGHGLQKGSWLANCFLKEEILAYHRADCIIAVTNEISDNIANYVDDPSKLIVFNNLVDTERFSSNENFTNNSDITILSPNRLVKRKGIKYLFDAVVTLKSSVGVRVIIAGDGPEKRNLKMYSRELGIDNIVDFVGEVDNSQMPQLIQNSDVVVIPSVSGEGGVEGTPMALLEAMACGVPVVASNIGGLPYVIQDGKSGFLVKERNSGELAEVLYKLAFSPMLRREMGLVGRRIVMDNYSLLAAAKKMEYGYLNLIKNKKVY